MAANTYTPEQRREYQRAYRAAGRDSTRNNMGERVRPFVAVDGEGGTHALTSPEYHAYWLLTAGTKSLSPRVGDVRLRTTDVFKFLCDLPRDPIYVVYFGDYDVTKILEDIPSAKLSRLLNRGERMRKDGRGTFPVSYGGFEFDYLPRKEFKVRRQHGTVVGVDGKTRPKFGPWFVLNDVGSFFQCRFVEAIEKWGIGTAEEWEHVARQKERRDSFDYSEVETVRAYNLLENKLLAELMEKFRDACIQVGYVPNKWQGPGQLAESMFRAHGVSMSSNVPLLRSGEYAELLTFARNAFYGGRPELSGIGPVSVPVYQFDINSAYPSAMREVPCLEHGRWIHGEYPDGVSLESAAEDVSVCLVRGRFRADLSRLSSVEKSGRPPLWYGLPVRDKSGSISYPSAGSGWYWSFEVAASIHQRMVVYERWGYVRECDCQPLGFVSDVYEQRQALGKDGPGIVLKLALNSLYGKTAQSIGSPKYSNPIWASFITAHCRAEIQKFIHQSEQCSPDGWCGSDVLMIATDSITTTNPRHDVEVSDALGGWGQELHPRGMFLVQPGLYFGSSGKHAKTRGVPRSVIEDFEGNFRSAFEHMATTRNITDGIVRVPQRLFAGIRLALHRRNFKILGQWLDFVDKEGVPGKAISFDWRTKRAPYPVLSPTEERSWLVTFPYEGSEDVETVPYSKDIGGLEEATEMRAMVDEQPEGVRLIEVAEMA